MALLVHPKHSLPTEDFHGLDELVNFERACEKRHNDIGRPLAALSQEDIMRGYVTVVDKQVVPNLWEAGTGVANSRRLISLTLTQSRSRTTSIHGPPSSRRRTAG